MEKHCPFLKCGVAANVCANFVITGIKLDINTKLKMTHSPKSPKNAYPEMQSIIQYHIYPLVENEFAWLFEPIKEWLDENNIKLYANFVSVVTAGRNCSGHIHMLTLMFGILLWFVWTMEME